MFSEILVWIAITLLLTLPSVVLYNKYILNKRNNLILLWSSVGSFLLVSALLATLTFLLHKSILLVAPISLTLTVLYYQLVKNLRVFDADTKITSGTNNKDIIKLYLILLISLIGIKIFSVFFLVNRPLTIIVNSTLLSIIITILCRNYYKEIVKALIPKKNSYYRIFRTVNISIIFGFIVSYGIIQINNNNIIDYTLYTNILSDLPNTILFSIIFLALIPSIFEEVFFRGVIFHKLLQFNSMSITIFISSILFVIIHFINYPFYSFLWLFPLGLLCGYLRAKEGNLIHSILAHFSYNSTVIILPFYILD